MSLDKPTLRNHLRQTLAAVTPEQRHARSAAATALLTGTAEFQAARVVMIYLSTPNEPDTTTIALRAWQQGKLVAAPRVSWDQRRMMPVEINSLGDEQMTVTGPGIREPREGAPMPVDMIDLVIVPGLGFAATGQRIGRGMGFYDRFLASRDFHGVSCGFAYEDQIVPELPVQEHDVNVAMLVTDQAVRRFKAFSVRA
jgi:5-formyltetrahydrofolate cyclo-ligase